MPEKTTRVRPKPKPTTAQQLRTLLATEGYRPRFDRGDGHPATIHFKVEGREYVLRFNEDDPDFVQVCTGYLLDGATRDELTLLRAANDVGSQVKVAKVSIPKALDCVEIQVELFLGGQPFSAALLQRSISAVRYGCREFFKRVIPEAPQARA